MPACRSASLLIAHADPSVFKLSIGVLLLVFPAALYFQREPMAFTFGGRTADAAVGFAGGILGGLAGLSGALPTLWASVRGWGKDAAARRFPDLQLDGAVRRPVPADRHGPGQELDVVWLALIAFPGTIAGAWLGTRTYRALSDRNFRDLVLALLFLSGIGLVWSSIGTELSLRMAAMCTERVALYAQRQNR